MALCPMPLISLTLSSHLCRSALAKKSPMHTTACPLAAECGVGHHQDPCLFDTKTRIYMIVRGLNPWQALALLSSPNSVEGVTKTPRPKMAKRLIAPKK